MNLWNRKDLEPPAITTYKAASFKGVADLKYHFKEALRCFNNLNLLEQESALLSRCIYRMKTKFRSDKGLKSMEKLNRCLRQFNHIKFKDLLENFYDLLPENSTDELYLPSGNVLDYILVRLQGVTQLMYRVVETAKITASHMRDRLSIGQFWKIALIMLGIAARIWILSRDIVKVCCNFYKNILSRRNNLKNVGSNWLPKDYSFPPNLEEWIGIDLNNFKTAISIDSFKRNIPVLDIVDADSDVEEMGEYVDIVDSDVTVTDVNMVETSEVSLFDLLMKKEDLGEILVGGEQLKKNRIQLNDSDEDVKNEKFTSKEKRKRKKTNKLTISENEHCENKKLSVQLEDSNEDVIKVEKTKEKLNRKRKKSIKLTINKNEDCQNKKLSGQLDDSNEDVIKVEKITMKQNGKRKKSNKITINKNEDCENKKLSVQLDNSNKDDTKVEKITKKQKKKRKNLNKITNENGSNQNITVKVNENCQNQKLINNKVLNESKCIKNKINEKKSKTGEFSVKHEKFHEFSRIDNLNSVKKLQIFMIKEHRKKENNDSSSLFNKLNKLQWNALYKNIKKCMKKFMNERLTDKECLKRAKEMLKINL